jgi:ATP-binding cassette subfamily F protein 2
MGRRYGIIGTNGSGKSNVLAAIAQRDIPVPEHIDMYHLHEEAPANEQTGVEAVIDHVKAEADRLENMSQEIMEESGPEDDRLEAIFNRLDELDPTGSEPRARKILFGLGFADHLIPMDRKTKHMSGGWRMRVSLAKALFAAPSLLLLDEPTNHLDLEACVWLEEHLAGYKKCLLVVSHSEDFMNAVCTDTIWLNLNTLKYYGGNYTSFCKVVDEEVRVQGKLYEKQQADIEKLANYVRMNKANGKAESAKSKKKVLEKVNAEAVERPIERGGTLQFEFPESVRLPPPVIPFDEVSFSYSGDKKDHLYENLDLAVDYDSRIALVGPNGCGKSTLLKLMSGALQPTRGSIKKHPQLVLGQYHQHSAEVLDNNDTPLNFMKKQQKEGKKMKEDVWISYLSLFGFNSKVQNGAIGMLSDGQKSRLIFALMALKNCGVLLLDEVRLPVGVYCAIGCALSERLIRTSPHMLTRG